MDAFHMYWEWRLVRVVVSICDTVAIAYSQSAYVEVDALPAVEADLVPANMVDAVSVEADVVPANVVDGSADIGGDTKAAVGLLMVDKCQF
jgi:hypothetical protein